MSWTASLTGTADYWSSSVGRLTSPVGTSVDSPLSGASLPSLKEHSNACQWARAACCCIPSTAAIHLQLPIDFPLYSLPRPVFLRTSSFPSFLPTIRLVSRAPSSHARNRHKMASPQHRYDDSDSEGGDFNPAPADLSDDERPPTSPVESRNDALRSSQSRDDNDADEEANGDSPSVNRRENKDDDEGEEDEDDTGPRKARDDDDDDEDEDEEEDEDDEDDMPVREMVPLHLNSLASTSHTRHA